MIITHHAVDFFKVSFGDITLAVNPISKDSKIKSTRFGADITLISSKDLEHSGSDSTSRGEKESFIVDGPGEYEISGIFIKGFLSKSNYGGIERTNTIYQVKMEGMNLCFLGALGEVSLPEQAKEATENCDILFLPIGGDGVLNPAEANKVSLQFEPKIIIPSHFEEVGEKESLKKFLKESGNEGVTPLDKLTIKKKEIETMEGEVMILKAV